MIKEDTSKLTSGLHVLMHMPTHKHAYTIHTHTHTKQVEGRKEGKTGCVERTRRVQLIVVGRHGRWRHLVTFLLQQESRYWCTLTFSSSAHGIA